MWWKRPFCLCWIWWSIRCWKCFKEVIFYIKNLILELMEPSYSEEKCELNFVDLVKDQDPEIEIEIAIQDLLVEDQDL
jgi:hypothetical protein